MNKLLTDVKIVSRVCRGDQEAMDFLANHWPHYCHEIDDIVDGERTDPAQIISTFARAIELYTHPFFVRHGASLRQVARNVTLMYAQTVAWEKRPAADHLRPEGSWRAQWADLHRHCSLEMVVAVATICGGYEHAAAVIPELREMAYHEHHNKNGEPV